MTASFVGVTGLPRAGSTLLCQLLGEHPQIYSQGHSSPLCSALLRMRHGISDDDFFLSQLDVDFELSYAHLGAATRGFVRGWYQDCDKVVVIDKNRAWLRNFEYLLHIEPDARLLVCVRDPVATMNEVYKWIGVDAHEFDPKRLTVRPHESDSHYRHKYPHRQHTSIEPSHQHAIPVRIQAEVERTYTWFYDNFYPKWKRVGA